MLLGEGRGGAIEAGLGVGDELDRDRLHAPLEAALGDEPVGEARAREMVFDAQAKPAGDDHGIGAMGQREVARYRAEREQASARVAVLARQIGAEIQGARDVFVIRRDALADYQRELESTGTELTRITQIAYQEGEVGILELLDSFRVSRTANLRALDLKTGVKEAFIELERVVGEEVRP